MAKILLLDFPAADRDRLVSQKYDVETRATGWSTGVEEPLELPEDCEIVFYQAEAGRPPRDGPTSTPGSTRPSRTGSGKASGPSASSAAGRRPSSSTSSGPSKGSGSRTASRATP